MTACTGFVTERERKRERKKEGERERDKEGEREGTGELGRAVRATAHWLTEMRTRRTRRFQGGVRVRVRVSWGDRIGRRVRQCMFPSCSLSACVLSLSSIA